MLPPLSTIIDVIMQEFEYLGAPAGMYCCIPSTLNNRDKDLEISHGPLHSGLSAKISTMRTSDMAIQMVALSLKIQAYSILYIMVYEKYYVKKKHAIFIVHQKLFSLLLQWNNSIPMIITCLFQYH
jgi:hypothetical protein